MGDVVQVDRLVSTDVEGLSAILVLVDVVLLVNLGLVQSDVCLHLCVNGDSMARSEQVRPQGVVACRRPQVSDVLSFAQIPSELIRKSRLQRH